jgi:iron(III) transport system ATP-binding protein
VALGPLTLSPKSRVKTGAVKVAIRPDAWQLLPAGSGMPARVLKRAYLGSLHEYSLEAPLGTLFVVSYELGQVHAVGADIGLALAGHGVSVVSLS